MSVFYRAKNAAANSAFLSKYTIGHQNFLVKPAACSVGWRQRLARIFDF
jgi:hypothetical protein